MRFKQGYLIVALICLAIVLISANLLFGQTEDPAAIEFPTWFVTGVGLLIPLFSQWILKNLDTSNKKFWGSLVLQIVFGVAGAFILGYSWNNLPELLGVIFVLAQLSYRLWWKALFEQTETGEALGLSPSKL